MKYLLTKLIANRDGIGLATFIAGLPFIYFLRDGLKLAPNNTFFGVFLLFFPLVLSLIFKNYKTVDMPNKVGISLLSLFTLISFVYLILRDRYSGVSGSRELLNYILILIIYLSTLFMRRDALNNTFFYVLIIISIIGGISLIYYTFTNPLYQFGQRASISFDEKGGGSGNPHVNSRGAFYGLIACVLVLKYKKNFKIGFLIPLFTILLMMAVLLLTQTMGAFLCTFIFLTLFFYYNYSFRQVGASLKFLLTKWYILLALTLGIVKGISSLDKKSDFITPITNLITVRLNNIVGSLSADGKKKSTKAPIGDSSANTRIELIGHVFERLDENVEKGKVRYVVFGNGYKSLYTDVPHLEVLDSFGILVFIFYTVLFFYLVRTALREIKNPESIGSEFIAYAFIYYFVANFLGGVIIDYSRLGMYFMLVRFVRK